MKNGMLKMFSAGVAVLGLVFTGSVLAQQTQQPNEAERAVLALCKAAGGAAAAAKTAKDCLDTMVAGGVIDARTASTMNFAVTNNNLNNNQFAIFVADVVNGAAAAPATGVAAAAALATRGIEVPTGTGRVDGETVAEVVTAPVVVAQAQTGYTQGLSGVRR